MNLRQLHRFTCQGATALSIAALLLLAGCATHRGTGTAEPLNLTAAKEAVISYVDSGAYERDLQSAAEAARNWVRERAARRDPGERLAVVFDVDETVISNFSHMREMDFGYAVDSWNAWVGAGQAPALPAVRAVFQECRRLGVTVFFVTGREEPRDRAGTEKNLREQGMGDYERLILADPAEESQSTAARKARARSTLERNEGYRIIASIGDQWSDLEGGFAERVFKLPNPFYRIP